MPAVYSLTMASSSNGDLGIVVESRGTAVVVEVRGEIDVVTAPQLQEALRPVLDGKPATIVVDLTAATFLASAGLAVLAELAQLAGPEAVVAVAAQPLIARPITLTGLDQVLGLYPTVQQALVGA